MATDESNPFEGHTRTDDLAPAALAAAVGLGRSLGLRVERAEVLADGFWLMVHLAPAPVVARVSTYAARLRPAAEHLARELDVMAHLDSVGAPVVTPSAELPPGPHRFDGHDIAFWTHLDVVPGAEVGLRETSALLTDLHAALAGYPGELAVFGPTAHDLPRCLAELHRAEGLLSPARLDAVRGAAARLAPFVADPGVPVQPVHGDVHPGNVLLTPDGPRWIDVEDVCRAPREWDLALLSWMGPEADVERHRPDPEVLALCSDLRALHILLWMIRFRGEQGEGPAYDRMITSMMPVLSDTRDVG
jgi:aminoglycoside phosphotransferase (APT) family kinase protein